MQSTFEIARFKQSYYDSLLDVNCIVRELYLSPIHGTCGFDSSGLFTRSIVNLLLCPTTRPCPNAERTRHYSSFGRESSIMILASLDIHEPVLVTDRRHAKRHMPMQSLRPGSSVPCVNPVFPLTFPVDTRAKKAYSMAVPLTHAKRTAVKRTINILLGPKAIRHGNTMLAKGRPGVDRAFRGCYNPFAVTWFIVYPITFIFVPIAGMESSTTVSLSICQSAIIEPSAG